MSQYIIQGIFAAAGVTALLAALFNWDWFFTARNTQFIVITHRRGTMEEADHLFGVTMQEKGVSRVIELSLDEAAKTIS